MIFYHQTPQNLLAIRGAFFYLCRYCAICFFIQMDSLFRAHDNKNIGIPLQSLRRSRKQFKQKLKQTLQQCYENGGMAADIPQKRAFQDTNIENKRV